MMATLLEGEEKAQDTSSRPSHAPKGGGSLAGETGPESCPLDSGINLVLALGSPFILSHCLAWGQLQELANGGCHSSSGKIYTEDEETRPRELTDTTFLHVASAV